MSGSSSNDMRIVSFNNSSKQVYVIYNHTVAYKCWMDALRKNIIRRGAFLCHIDYHLDFEFNYNLLKEDEKISDDQEQALEIFIRDNLINTHFIAYAMNRGLLGDGLAICTQESEGDNVLQGSDLKSSTDRIEFIDKVHRAHYFYLGGSSLIKLYDENGLLSYKSHHKDLKEAFDRGLKNENFVLDIDLDYFTCEDTEGGAMKKDDIDYILNSEAFIRLFDSAQVITIALEPHWCGGIEECKIILRQISLFLKEHLNIDIETRVFEIFKEYFKTKKNTYENNSE